MNKRDDRKSAARVVREQIAAEQRRKRLVWGGVVGVVVLAVVGLITWTVVQSNNKSAVNTPAHANKDGNGIGAGTGGVVVEDYIDFMCPHCKAFHDEAGPSLSQLVTENKITLVQHPLAYLDRASTTSYSTRSSAASGCAADGGKFQEYSDVLFANQPAEGSAGLSDDQLISLGTGVGLKDTFANCVKEKRYQTWSKKVSDDATKAGVTGTPTVFVNGKKVTAGTAELLAAIEAAAGPAPTPSAS